MRPGQEAVTLPLIFLSVALMGGFRSSLTGGMRFLAPELSYLVLAVFILGVAFRSGLLLPHLLISRRRTPLENASGSIVLATLFLASAQSPAPGARSPRRAPWRGGASLARRLQLPAHPTEGLACPWCACWSLPNRRIARKCCAMA